MKSSKLLEEQPELELVRRVLEDGEKRGVFRLDGKRPMGLQPLRYLDDGTDLNQTWETITANFYPESKPI